MTDPEPGRISREELYEGRIVRLSLDTVRFPGGSTGTLELVRHAGAAAVVPFLDPPSDPDPSIVLVHQYRYAAGGRIYEVPAGMPDRSDEPWEGCARRELLEETGYEAGELRYLTSILTTPGFTDELIHLFSAMDLRGGAPPEHDVDEFMEVTTVPLSEAVEGVRSGEIRDAKTVSALLFVASFPDMARTSDRSPPHR